MGGGVFCLPHPLSLSVQMNALFRNILHAEAQTDYMEYMVED